MKMQESILPRDPQTVVSNAAAPGADTHQSVSHRVASSAHDTIDSAAAKAEEFEAQLRAGVVKAGSTLDATQEAATAQAERSLAKLESFVKARPIAAAGIAFAAGILATALLRR
jgi:ElaB/YqjD/DUF883 family membrane-anchored ribosome-binding protein